MMITPGIATTEPVLRLEQPANKSLASLLYAQGFLSTPTLKLHCVIPCDTVIEIVDDLQQHGFGKVEIHFEIEAGGKLNYLLREVQANQDTLVLERSITCTLAGKEADAVIRCLYFGDSVHMFKINTLQDHKISNATSKVEVKAVLTDSARLSCRSMISVAPGADGSFAEQVNKNILLSSQARAVSIPMLEVLANDVKCKHGAAVSKLDDEQIFYLQSRGLTTEQTRTMLLDAFLS